MEDDILTKAVLLLEGLEADLIMFSAGISACPGNPAGEAD